MIFILSYLILTWLIFLKLYAKDPGYIESVSSNSEFDPNILRIRLEKTFRDDNILNFTSLRNLFKKPSELKRIDFESPKWSNGSRMDSFEFGLNEEHRLANFSNDIENSKFGEIQLDKECNIEELRIQTDNFDNAKAIIGSVRILIEVFICGSFQQKID